MRLLVRGFGCFLLGGIQGWGALVVGSPAVLIEAHPLELSRPGRAFWRPALLPSCLTCWCTLGRRDGVPVWLGWAGELCLTKSPPPPSMAMISQHGHVEV